jgi:hypothetical protein
MEELWAGANQKGQILTAMLTAISANFGDCRRFSAAENSGL